MKLSTQQWRHTEQLGKSIKSKQTFSLRIAVHLSIGVNFMSSAIVNTIERVHSRNSMSPLLPISRFWVHKTHTRCIVIHEGVRTCILDRDRRRELLRNMSLLRYLRHINGHFQSCATSLHCVNRYKRMKPGDTMDRRVEKPAQQNILHFQIIWLNGAPSILLRSTGVEGAS